MRRIAKAALVVVVLVAGAASGGSGTTTLAVTTVTRGTSVGPRAEGQGQRAFRFDAFGDEQLWTEELRLHEVVESRLDPITALKLGLKVDAEALPPGMLLAADLESPATTVALLKMNAIVGLQATFDSNDRIVKLGISCALCHSSVDDSVRHGIGHRKDGVLNRDLNVGAIFALSPARYDPGYGRGHFSRRCWER